MACYNNVFILAVDLPSSLHAHEIVASKDNKYLYTIGPGADVYKFSCTNSITNCSWTVIPTKLQNGRSHAVAMQIPNALANKLCQKGIAVTTKI